MIKCVIIGKYLFPLTDECAAAMMRAGREIVERQPIAQTRVFKSIAEVDAQAFRDRTGFET